MRSEIRALIEKLTKMSFARFMVSGGVNTALTYAVYLLLLTSVPYQTSYTIAYALGIVFAFIMNRFFVFKSHRGARSLALFPLVYLAQYLISMLVIWIWVDTLKLSELIAPLISIIITIPITYLISKYVFLKKQN